VIVIEEGRVVETIGVDVIDGEPTFQVNDHYAFYVQGGRLWRRNLSRSSASSLSLAGQSAELWGDVLAGQTRIWVGNRLGFGYYRAGNVAVAFTFDPEKRGIRDTVRLPWPNGQIIKSRAAIDDNKIWFFLAFATAGRIIHRAVVFSPDGTVLGSVDAAAGDGSWLGSIAGHRAVGGLLFSPTDTGIVRVECDSGIPSETKKFVDTEPFIHAGASLFVTREGIFAVQSSEITLVSMN
jgi:hypothetical protein